MTNYWTPATAAVAFLLYIVSLIGRIRSSPGRQASAIRLEALAWLILLIHVVVAFAEFHDWSLAAAEKHVANRTAASIGLRWGWAIHLNYATLILWPIAIDARRRRLSGGVTKPSAVERAIDLFVAFLWFNATIPFGSTAARVMGTVGFGLTAAMYATSRTQRPVPTDQLPTATP